MEIYINNEILDAKISDEKNASEIFSAISSWLQKNRRFILGCRVNERDVSVQKLNEISADQVERMDFEVGDEMDMLVSTLTETDRYVEQIGSVLFERETLDAEDIKNLVEGTGYLKEIMISISSIIKTELSKIPSPFSSDRDEHKENMEEVVDRMTEAAKSFSPGIHRDEYETFLMDLRILKMYLMGLVSRFETVMSGREELIESIEEFEKRIPDMKEEIVSINEDLNTGKDAGALDTLDKIVLELNGYTSAVFALDQQLQRGGNSSIPKIEVNGVPFSEKAEALTVLLKNIAVSLEERDMVALGDILEYELTEHLENLFPYLPEIRRISVETV